VIRQRELAGVSRATVYAKRTPQVVAARDLLHCRLIDEQYTRRPFYGSRKMAVHLKGLNQHVNRKRVQRLMRAMGLAGMAPGPNTSKAHPEHKVYPYLLRGVPIVRPNQVWSTHLVHSAGARLRLSGSGDRLVQPQGTELEDQQQHGGRVLRGLFGRRASNAWAAGSF
jgi:transposase InsO family protein